MVKPFLGPDLHGPLSADSLLGADPKPQLLSPPAQAPWGLRLAISPTAPPHPGQKSITSHLPFWNLVFSSFLAPGDSPLLSCKLSYV